MNYYIAKLVFNIQANGKTYQHQFDEQLRLIVAATFADAFLKARLLGEKEQTVFKNQEGNNIVWKFIDVAEILHLKTVNHGTELYSFTREEADSQDYINFIKRKAQQLQIQNITFAY